MTACAGPGYTMRKGKGVAEGEGSHSGIGFTCLLIKMVVDLVQATSPVKIIHGIYQNESSY